MHKSILHSISEKQLQAMIIEAAQLTGWMTYHTYDSRRSSPGYPDLALCHPQCGYLLLELKTEKGRIRPEQQRWLDALQAAGIEARIVRPRDWDELIERLQRKPRT